MIRRGIVLCAVLTALLCAQTAAAQNAPDPRLDAAASSVAGHPVTVYCEMSWTSWLAKVPSDNESGFTMPADSVVYVNPQVCLTLTMLLHGDDAGAMYASQAILTLAHESEHQHGLVDEGATDCAALPLVPGLATQFFGVPGTILQTVAASKTIFVRIGKKTKRVSVTYAKTVSVANPYLARLAADAVRWHRSKPPTYQGNC